MDPRDIKKITEEDKVIILREQGRLERSLIEAEKFNCEKIFAILHYPPLMSREGLQNDGDHEIPRRNRLHLRAYPR